MDDIQLIPLKIPAGFAVCYNKFYDVEPVKSKENDDFIENWHYFTEDILQIVKMDLKEGSWYIPAEHLLIDLGWYPDANPVGRYVLELAVVREDHSWETLDEIESTDRVEIKNSIEKWLRENIAWRRW